METEKKYSTIERECMPHDNLDCLEVPDISLWSRVYIANRPPTFGLFEDSEVS
jgi:hypothetical protein